MNEKARSLLIEIHRGARLIFENAEHLYDEAQILGGSRAFSRSLCLHQISIEECSKLDVLGVAATELLLGHAVDLEKLMARMRRHEAKNFNAAYFSEPSQGERQAWDEDDTESAARLFRAAQKEFHEHLNTNKNASLYVDYRDGKFVTPAEQITEEMAVRIQQLNGEFLGRASLAVRVLDRAVADTGNVATSVTALVASIEELRASRPGVPAARLLKAIRDWIDQHTKRSP